MRTKISATGRARSQAGFTIPEALVVLLMVSLAAMAVAAATNHRSDAATVDAQAHRLAAELRHLRTSALARGTPVFSPAAPITFYADGSSSGGTVRLTTGEHTRLVVVEPITARIWVVTP